MKVKTVILGIALLLLLTACQPAARTDNATGEELLADLMTRGEVIQEQDSHGGFHGDGLTFLQISYTDDVPLKEIADNADWQPLPLPEPLAIAVYGDATHGVYLSEDETPLIGEIEEGYYYFQDRHDAAKDPSDPSNLLDRGSFNFILAIYDAKAGTLSYFRLDT